MFALPPSLHQLLLEGSLSPFPLCLSLETTAHSSQRLFSLDSLLNPSFAELGWWKEKEEERERGWGEKKERLLSTPPPPPPPPHPPAHQTYLCSAVTDTGWVALTFTVNHQRIDCVLMSANGKLTQLIMWCSVTCFTQMSQCDEYKNYKNAPTLFQVAPLSRGSKCFRMDIKSMMECKLD